MQGEIQARLGSLGDSKPAVANVSVIVRHNRGSSRIDNSDNRATCDKIAVEMSLLSNYSGESSVMAFELPSLPYAEDALEPHIDARTMGIHHGKHHAGYTDKLNAAIAGTALDGKSIEAILGDLDGAPGRHSRRRPQQWRWLCQSFVSSGPS